MVQLHYYDDKGTADTSDDEGYFCGGTLVAPTKVLTAAHCVDGLDWAKNGAVVAAGDFTGDGRPDLPARDGSGVMWLYKGTGLSGTATFEGRVQVGAGWGAFDLFS